jgi:uncharacterized repeat protein (TIGR03803 family)
MNENNFITAATAADHDGSSKRIQRVSSFCIAILALIFAFTFATAQAQTFKVLHEFNGELSGNGQFDGANPAGGLVRDAAGNLYGTTVDGGNGEGVLFKIESTGQEKILFTFHGFDGGVPATALLLDPAGNLSGIADGGPGAGMIFKIAQDGVETRLFTFPGSSAHQPEVPTGGISTDKAGNIFGTTFFGGRGNCEFGSCGSIFRLDAAHKLHVLHNFSGGADGSRPLGPLVQDATGNLYGIAQQGGVETCPGFPSSEFQETGCGTVFKITTKGVLTVLHSFTGGAQGAIPQSGLLLDAAGNIYGATLHGGTRDFGTVFKISANGTYTVLHRFTGKDGSLPNGSLVADPAGNLYGTTEFNGSTTLGKVFKLSPTGKLTVLHSFTGGDDGATPLSGVILDAAGNIYGTASKNFLVQEVQGGNVFEITP